MSFLTLGEYLNDAKKIMIAQNYGFLTRDEDAVSDVAYRMMVADNTWDGSSSRTTWRYNQARYAIFNILSKKRKKKKVNIQSLDYGWDMLDGERSVVLADKIEDRSNNVEVKDRFQEVCDVSKKVLTDRQRECFDMYYLEHMTLEEVGNSLGISRQAVSLHLIQAREEIKRCVSEQD